MDEPITPPADTAETPPDASADPPADVPATLFEALLHRDEAGDEYWSARELAPVLGYRRWENFRTVIIKAQIACANSSQIVADHFRDVTKMVALGSGAQRGVEDYHLSRYACYLIVQNADPNKPVVALGQTYFAVQTRRQEEADALVGLTEAQRRQLLRAQLARHNRELAATAQQAGVVTGLDFAIFQDHGYRGLYGGLRMRDIQRRKQLRPSQQILDHMGSTELAANLFRATQTEEKIRREGIQGTAAANQAHHDMGQAVREFIAEQGGPMPEDLPTPGESIGQLQTQERRRLAAEQRPQAAGQAGLFSDEPITN